MKRNDMLARLAPGAEPWDFIIIGGGATGVGTAIDAAARGYRTLLLEQGDFGQGTSSRSTKLIHGGVRYLKQGNLSLVLEALNERRLLRQNAPHLVRPLPFVVPNYHWWEAPFYGMGLRLYDLLAGRQGFPASKHLSKAETVQRVATIATKGLRGSIAYYDGQFDDARLLINMVGTAAEQGATLLNYVKVTALVKAADVVTHSMALDLETQAEYQLRARVVINATGVFADSIRRMDDPCARPVISPSQGVHLVLSKSFLPGDNALMVPYTDDGRVLFAIPWHDRVIVGTTDTPVDDTPLEPRPQWREIEFLLSHAARYLSNAPTPNDVLSVFTGLRPLVGAGARANPAAISRDHRLYISPSGLVTITGGKWTTYRKMAEDTVNRAAAWAHLPVRPCVTRDLPIHGHHPSPEQFGDLARYGADAPAVQELLREDPRYPQRLHPAMTYRAGEVIWAVRHEMARTLEDVLARRTRALLLDARASLAIAPTVASLMAAELRRDQVWIRQQLNAYHDLAARYLLASRPAGA